MNSGAAFVTRTAVAAVLRGSWVLLLGLRLPGRLRVDVVVEITLIAPFLGILPSLIIGTLLASTSTKRPLAAISLSLLIHHMMEMLLMVKVVVVRLVVGVRDVATAIVVFPGGLTVLLLVLVERFEVVRPHAVVVLSNPAFRLIPLRILAPRPSSRPIRTAGDLPLAASSFLWPSSICLGRPLNRIGFAHLYRIHR